MLVYQCIHIRLSVIAIFIYCTVPIAGNYMQMMHVLKPIASDVLECLTQLFDYYLYAVSLLYWVSTTYTEYFFIYRFLHSLLLIQ